LTTAELSALAISALSLLVALAALYRADLRGPRVTVKLLEAPTKWDVQGGSYLTERDGGNAKSWRVQASTPVPLLVENTGPRSGVVHGLRLELENPEKSFEIIGAIPETTFTISGKESRTLLASITLEKVVNDLAHIVSLYKSLPPDLHLRALSRANGPPFGQIKNASDQINVSTKPLIDPVAKWVKPWMPKQG